MAPVALGKARTPVALIIDAYNLLFAMARFGGRPVGDAIGEARAHLLGLLVRHHQRTGEAATVVFDSRQLTGGARRQERFPGIRFSYCHLPQTADDEIRRLVESSTAPQHLRVVTSDRELARACSGRGAVVVGARAFFRELTQGAREAKAEEHEQDLKSQPPSDEEVRRWLRAFGRDDESDEPRR